MAFLSGEHCLLPACTVNSVATLKAKVRFCVCVAALHAANHELCHTPLHGLKAKVRFCECVAALHAANHELCHTPLHGLKAKVRFCECVAALHRSLRLHGARVCTMDSAVLGLAPLGCGWYGARFRHDFEDDIGSHGCSLEALHACAQ
jgi:hypothetical protein